MLRSPSRRFVVIALSLFAALALFRRGAAASAGGLYLCGTRDCGYVYDPAEGDPSRDIPPGTAFADLPRDWVCPVCGGPHEAFRRYDLGA